MGFDPLAYAFGAKGSGYPGGRDLVSYLMGKNAAGDAYTEFTGNPLEFDAKKAAALKSCIVTLNPIQPGSGDPTPENVRPISGRTAVNVFIAAEYDASADPAVTVTFPTPPGTVYGGTLDVVSGKLTVDKAYLYMDGSVSVALVNYYQAAGIYYTYVNNNLGGINTTDSAPHVISSRFKTNRLVAVGNTYVTSNGNVLIAVLPDQTANTKQLATAWFTDNPTQFVYDLAEPIEYTLSPQEIAALVGRNVMWTDGDGLSVEAKGKAVEIAPAQQLNMLLGGRYVNAGTPDDVPDAEALNIIMGGNR